MATSMAALISYSQQFLGDEPVIINLRNPHGDYR